MGSNGPLIDPDALRKNVNGTLAGLPPVSVTWEAKLVICATTRQGTVTGDTSARLSTGTMSAATDAAVIAGRSASSSAVVRAAVGILVAPEAVRTHHASAVRRTVVVMRWLPSAGRAGGRGRIRCPRA